MKHIAVKENVCEDDSGLDKESLLLTVEALKAQLEEQTKLCKEQVSSVQQMLHIHAVHVMACRAMLLHR